MVNPYRVVLTEEERAELRGLISVGVAPARMLTRARVLLKAEKALSQEIMPSVTHSAQSAAPTAVANQSANRCSRLRTVTQVPRRER